MSGAAGPAECIFCRIVRGEIPARKAYEDEEIFAFHDIRPQAPVHLLVIPKRPIPALADVAAGDEILSRAGIPTFPYPDTAARTFMYMWRYTSNLNLLYETPALAHGEHAPDRTKAGKILDGVRKSKRTLLTEFESKELLAAYRIPTVETRIAKTVEQAAKAAEAIGYPVVPALYVVAALFVVVQLAIYRGETTWPGFAIVLLGVPVGSWLLRRRAAGGGASNNSQGLSGPEAVMEVPPPDNHRQIDHSPDQALRRRR